MSGQMSWSQEAGSVWSHLQEVQPEAESWLQGLREGNGGDHEGGWVSSRGDENALRPSR